MFLNRLAQVRGLRYGAMVATAVAAALVCAGCSASSSCWCDGEELDFSDVGDLAGVWESEEGFALRFDRDHRPRHYEGEWSIFLGCNPEQYPLIVGSETVLASGAEVYTRTLTEANVEPGGFELTWSGNLAISRLSVELEGDTLLVEAPVVPMTFMRTAEDPVQKPTEVGRCR